MLQDYIEEPNLPTIAPEFSSQLIECFNSTIEKPVSELYNEWWKFAPASVVEKYVAFLRTDPNFVASYEEKYFGENFTLDEITSLPHGTLGKAYANFIEDNALEPNIASMYREKHERLMNDGTLENMPDEIKYATLRAFQLHDFMHVLTGYRARKTGEQATLAFCFAQSHFPYFGIWMSVTHTRMTFVDPNMIDPLMSAISEAWLAGKRAVNVQFSRPETLLEEQLAGLRVRFAINTSEIGARAAA